MCGKTWCNSCNAECQGYRRKAEIITIYTIHNEHLTVKIHDKGAMLPLAEVKAIAKGI